jgi:hypothetical protein
MKTKCYLEVSVNKCNIKMSVVSVADKNLAIVVGSISGNRDVSWFEYQMSPIGSCVEAWSRLQGGDGGGESKY